MRLVKLLCHDMREGFWNKRGMYLFAVFLSLLSGIELSNKISALREVENVEGVGSVMDYWIYLIQGRESYTFDWEIMYEFPLFWIGFFLFLLMAINMHPSYDLEHWGYQMVTRGKSRCLWWLSKCIWCSACCAIYFAVAALVTLLVAIANGAAVSLRPTWYVMEVVFVQKAAHISLPMLFLMEVLMPCLMAVFVSLLQTLLSLLIHPMASYCISVSIIVISTYSRKYFLPGNWGMPYRLNIAVEGGLRWEVCLALEIAGIVLCVLVGKFLFDRLDILEKRVQ